tara:strand:- start:3051 stop:3650 length:600 start_codon:yes stop_codon:yes gene_type:complete
MKTRVLSRLFILILFLLSSNSCIERDFKDLGDIPKFEEVEGKNLINRFEIGRYFNNKKSFNWQDTEVPKDIGVVMVDSLYKPVDYYYFKKFNKWFNNLLFNNGIMSVDPKQSLDCDNFAMLYKSLFGVASYANDKDIEFAVAVVVVEQRNEFGGIPKGYLHMLNLVFTNKDWYIFEPQTGKYIELHKYPNQKYIKYIIL